MKKLIVMLLVIILSGCGSGVKPDSDAGPDQVVLVNDLVTLDASGTTDHDNDPLTYSWAITTAPETSTATLTDPDTINPTFTPDIEGNYIVELTASDSDWSDIDTVLITALLAPVDPDGLVQVLVFHSIDTIAGWQPSQVLADAGTIITTQYLSLVDDWNAGIIIATQIAVPAADAFHPELYEVVDWVVSLTPTE